MRSYLHWVWNCCECRWNSKTTVLLLIGRDAAISQPFLKQSRTKQRSWSTKFYAFLSLLWLMRVLLCIRIVTFQNVAGIFVCDIHIICKKLVWSVGVCISEKRYIYRSNGDHYNSRTTSRYRWRCREDGWASDLEVSRRSLISCLCSFAVGVWGWPQSDRGRTETGVVPSG